MSVIAGREREREGERKRERANPIRHARRITSDLSTSPEAVVMAQSADRSTEQGLVNRFAFESGRHHMFLKVDDITSYGKEEPISRGLDVDRTTRGKVFMMSKVQCLFCFEISTPEEEKRAGVQISKQSTQNL